MSYSHRYEHARARQEKAGPPYDREKQAVTQSEAEVETQAKAPLHLEEHMSEEERRAAQEQAAAERLAKIGREDREDED
jgi:hypothetical protein